MAPTHGYGGELTRGFYLLNSMQTHGLSDVTRSHAILLTIIPYYHCYLSDAVRTHNGIPIIRYLGLAGFTS